MRQLISDRFVYGSSKSACPIVCVLAWSKEQDDLFIPIDEGVQQALATVVTAFPNLADHHRDRSGADPWVIAQAMQLNCPVVTYETMGKQTKPKIPNACKHFGIEVYTWVDVLRETGFRA